MPLHLASLLAEAQVDWLVDPDQLANCALGLPEEDEVLHLLGLNHVDEADPLHYVAIVFGTAALGGLVDLVFLAFLSLLVLQVDLDVQEVGVVVVLGDYKNT